MRALSLSFLLLGALTPRADAGSVAGSVVRSKEWKIKRAPAAEEEFIGDVRYQSGPTRFSSDWALFQHDKKLWQARGNVSVSRTLASAESLEARGDRAEYDQASQKGWLAAKKGELLEFTRTPVGAEPEHGRGEKLEWEGRDDILLTGRVHAWGPLLEVWAERAHWKEERLELSGGRPVLHRRQGEDWTGAVKADRIVASRAGETVTADGKAAGWILFKRSPLEGRR